MSFGTRRHQSRGETTSVSLFPFLAVLICTMGALIVLLVVTVQHAGDSTTGKTEPAPIASIASTLQVDEPTADELQIADSTADDPLQLHQNASQLETLRRTKEDLAWQADSMASARQSTLERLKKQQLHLSGIEDQSFTLQRELTRLRDEVEAMKQAAAGEQPDERAAAQLEQLEADLKLAQENLKKSQQEKVERPRYTIIPHRGANGTNRRPLYVECLPDKVILRPEGLVFREIDFRGPLGTDNPIASALRAKREFLLNAGAVASSGEPYPLLLVRPGGELFYGRCRAALADWDEEFGYELVPKEFDLVYPPANPVMAGFMEQIVKQARTRRERALAMAVTTMDAVSDGTVIMGISQESGGFVPTGSTPTRRPAGSVAEREKSGFGSSAVATASAESAGEGGTGLGLPGTSSSQGPASSTGKRQSDWQENSNSASPMDANGLCNAGSGGSFKSPSGDDSIPSSMPNERAENQSSSDVPVGHCAIRGDSATKVRTPTSQSGPAHNVASGPVNSSEGSGSHSNGSSSGSPASANGPASSAAAAQFSSSIAKTQGQNWALPNDTVGAIGVVRPVLLTCTKESIILHPESRIGLAQMEIPFAVTTSSAVQPFIGALWSRMEDWGTAGIGMYWQPQIQCEVIPGGEERFQELSGLLHGSGMTITRR